MSSIYASARARNAARRYFSHDPYGLRSGYETEYSDDGDVGDVLPVEDAVGSDAPATSTEGLEAHRELAREIGQLSVSRCSLSSLITIFANIYIQFDTASLVPERPATLGEEPPAEECALMGLGAENPSSDGGRVGTGVAAVSSEVHVRCRRVLTIAEKKTASRPSTARISAAPSPALGDLAFVDRPCLRCAKQIGTVGFACLRGSSTSKCFRCTNNNDGCRPIPRPFLKSFHNLQALFREGRLDEAFASRDKWVRHVEAAIRSQPELVPGSSVRSSTPAHNPTSIELLRVMQHMSYGIELINRNLERLISFEMERVSHVLVLIHSAFANIICRPACLA